MVSRINFHVNSINLFIIIYPLNNLLTVYCILFSWCQSCLILLLYWFKLMFLFLCDPF